ncbi:MAG TPA: geranylgeranylglyceryl/heptaprenylglyceryl phosphate synthase [Bacteroidales bacterium]|nr:geranylgeranylglyceryl/heptaprenylglyceryl phosphate synthase [Bacteroidales bacterium]
MNNLYFSILKKKSENRKQFAVLVDPDKITSERIGIIAGTGNKANIDYFFVGGSLLTNSNLENCIKLLKQNSDIPVVLFPGNTLQINPFADAILLLSLISGRNPEMLIGKHVIAAPFLKESRLEIIPTGYMLIDSGKPTTASYISNTFPIPADKDDVAVCTAMAGEMLGLKIIYMDGGSGARNPITESMIKSVRQSINIPLIVGGGICTPEKAILSCKAGADLIVVGNAFEKSPELITDIAQAVQSVDYK